MDDLIRRQDAIDALNKLDVSDGVGISSIACGVQESAIIVIQHLPSAQPEVLAHGEGESMSGGLMLMIGDDGIAREYSDEFDVVIHCESEEEREKVIEALKSKSWTPVKYHEITDEERWENDFPKEWAVLLDNPMPEDGEEILISTKSGFVKEDVNYEDDLGNYLDSGYDWVDDVTAWMPMPKPYEEEANDKTTSN